MASIKVSDYKKLDINSIVFNPPQKTKGGSYMSIPTEDIYIQTPRLLSSKGIVKNETRCSLELDFDKKHGEFYEFVTNIDDYSIIQIQKNSLKWFKKEFPLDIVEEFYSSPVKNARGKNPPKLKIKIPLVKGDLNCSIYNSDNNLISYNDIKLDSKLLCVLKFQGLKFLKQQVICEWLPIQIKVFQKGVDSVYMINDNLLSDKEVVSEAEEVREEPTEEVSEEPTEESVANEEPTREPIEEPTEEPTREPTEEQTREPVADEESVANEEPTREPIEEPTREPTREEQTDEPVADEESVEKPVVTNEDVSDAETVVESLLENPELVNNDLLPDLNDKLETDLSQDLKIEDINLETDLENNDDNDESFELVESDSDKKTELNAPNIEELQKTIENQKLQIYNLETKLNKLKEFIN